MDVLIWKKNCPLCDDEQQYSSKKALLASIEKNCLCGSCARSGKNNPQYGKTGTNAGKTFSKEHRRKISESKLGNKHWGYGKHLTNTHKKNQSKSLRIAFKDARIKERQSHAQHVRYLNKIEREKTSKSVKKVWCDPEIRKKYINAISISHWLKVRCDMGQTELLNKWNALGFHFEQNYQVCSGDLLYYLDGYDKEKNVILEYDGKYHTKPSQKIKDSVRQQNIIDILHPKKFWRYDAINKKCSNILDAKE